MIILIFLSLLATDCRVHRGPMADTVGCEIAVGVVSRMPQGCLTKSHWIDTCKMRCDTVWYYRERLFGFRYVTDSIPNIHCYPDTAIDSGWWFSVPDGKIDIRKPAEEDTLWIFDTPFLRSEMPDLKEMLREWRVARCIQTAITKAKDNGSWWFGDVDERTLRDSCRCVYGGGK